MRLSPAILRPADRYKNAVRALSPAAWFKPGVGVTGTLTASAWADQSGYTGRDLLQATGANQPINLPHTGADYAYFSGVTGNLFKSANAATISGNDLEIIAIASMDTMSEASNRILVSTWNGSSTGWHFGFFPGTNRLYLHPSETGAENYQTTVTIASLGLSANTFYYWKVTRNGTTGDINFYHSTDGSSYTKIGATVAGSTGAITTGAVGTAVGCHPAVGSAMVWLGKIQSVQVKSTIGGSAVIYWKSSDFVETSTNGTTATASTGEVWTLNSTGAKPATVVKSPQLLGDGTNHKMATSNFTLDQPFTDYIVARQITWTSGDFLSSGTAGAAGITQRTGTPKIGLDAGSGVADNADATLGTKCVITAVFNGASSSLQVNNGTATTGNPGAGNPGGLSLFSDNAGANYGNAIVWERIAFPAAHDAVTRALVQRYASLHHGIALS